MKFEPIAIVGQSAILPGALSPAELWTHVLAGRSLLSRVPDDRWGLDPSSVRGTPEAWSDRTWSDVGGYVDGFPAAFDPRGFALDAEEIAALDPLTQWALHGVREALRSAGCEGGSKRAGLVMGNLSFPSSTLTRYAESVWLDAQGPSFAGGRARAPRPHARNRFHSGLPARLTARALGLGASAFALDAACAASLYAIKLACDRLHDRSADVMVAGAVNRADDLFIHIGFCALSAMSRTGQSRPFHADADGLVPSEGAGFVVLQRLEDAVRAGRPVLGVIRGVGLANDGRGRGLLAPSEEGQERAMRLAYAMAGLSPKDIGLVECHATGTPVGDATELRSTGRVYEGLEGVPIGSLKSNLGHLVTVAGVAGLMKVLGAMEHGRMPKTLHADVPNEALRGSPFRLLTTDEPWSGPRRAAVSAFGFGGNNAHLLVEAYDGSPRVAAQVALDAAPQATRATIAIVAVGARVGDGDSADAFAASVLDGAPAVRRRETIDVALAGLKFPPRDLSQALAQQTVVLEAIREAAEAVTLPRDRTSVLVGMGCDPEIARYGARWRLPGWAAKWAPGGASSVDRDWLTRAQETFHASLDASGVLGTMPNIPANRANSQLDVAGPSFTISEEEGSGLRALELAARALAAGEIDAAVVAAVDLSVEPVHEAALRELGRSRTTGDAAVALVLKRLDDAARDGDSVLAVLDDARAPGDAVVFGDGEGQRVDLTERFGHAHAANGLVHVAAAAVAIHHGALPSRDGAAAAPWMGERRARIVSSVLEGEPVIAAVAAAPGAAPTARVVGDAGLRFAVYGGATRAEALDALGRGEEREAGPARVVIAARSDDELASRRAAARRWIELGGPCPEGVAFREAPAGGELAFVFSGAAGAYRGMARDLALAVPDLVSELSERCRELTASTSWLYGDGADRSPHPLDQLWGSSFVCQLHAMISRQILGLEPQAAIGYSSGESNALFALGAWTDMDAMIRASREEPLFTRDLVAPFDAAHAAWRRAGVRGTTWASHCVAAPLADVEAAVSREPLVHVTVVNSGDDCVVSGEAEACARVVAALGVARTAPLTYEIVAHTPELAEVRDAWWTMHHRAFSPVPHVRFYSSGCDGPIAQTSEAAADAITAQAVGALDFRRSIERAYADGVRVFLEHGPRGACTGWIRQILGDRDHVAIALDAAGRSSLAQLTHAVAWLVAAGVPVDVAALTDRLAREAPAPRSRGPVLTLPAHPPAPILPPFEITMQTMARAPRLPSVLAAAAAAPSLAAPPSRTVDVPDSAPPHVDAMAPTTAHAPAQAFAAPTPRVAAAFGGERLEAPRAAPPFDAATASAGDDVLARLAAHHAQIASMHHTFIAQQATLHQSFLAMRQRAEAMLVGALDHAGAAAPWADRSPVVEHLSDDTSVTLHSAPSPVSLATDVASPPLAAPPPVVVTDPVVVWPTTPAPQAPSRIERRVEAPALSPSPTPSVASPAAERALPGPKYGRAELEVLASGKISTVLGPMFAVQDDFHRQVRMPEPPLLLADRVTGIAAEPGSMTTGTIWTETDVRKDSWYLTAEGRMPAGIMIESGQADLLLISWLGADFQNRGERVYRLLGCELTYHGSLPVPGETLAYDIHVDGHAQQDDVRIFFFHYDCRVNGEKRLSVRHGQAGFFTDEELAGSGGVLWDPATEKPKDGPFDAPAARCTKTSLTKDELVAFSEGRAYDCFGPGWERAQPHVRTPQIAGGRMRFLDRVTTLDATGGPWGRGYLRAETDVSPDDWFFAGHFKNDPCMPGTLMFEACLQAMAVHLASLGFTIERDAWRFEPVPEEKYLMRCRGQVTPKSKQLVYEVFVSEVIAGPTPTIFADLLCTVDGLKAFHAKRVGLRLVPDWPLSRWRELGPARTKESSAPMALADLGGMVGYVEPKPVASVDGFEFGYHSLLACAWGKPSEAFGPSYTAFDGVRRGARLPGPPYHFMSRVTRIDGPMHGMKVGSEIEVEYDVPPAQWYFDENGAPTMPFCVLMEAALQPCGWLATYIGSALTTDQDLLFRNLDGTGTLRAELLPTTGTLRTRTKLTNISKTAGMIIVSFDVDCHVGDSLVFDMKTVFGYFPPEAFVDQAGLPVTDEIRARLEAPSDYRVDLTERPAKFCAGAPRLAGPMLLMLDRITGYWPDGGKAGLGAMRGEKSVDPDEWFFKAHFFQDPVQPGSLGVEALCQLLQALMIERGMGEGMKNPRFEPVMTGRAVTWKYRGQVVPQNELIRSEIEITEIGEDEHGRYAIAEGSLWVDSKRAYHLKDLGMRIVDGELPSPPRRAPEGADETLDPARDRWLLDHCPTWTLPAMPMMSMVDRMAAAARLRAGRPVSALTDVQVKRWLPFPGGPIALRAEVEIDGDEAAVTLHAWREAADARLSRFEPVATARASFAPRSAPTRFAALTDGAPMPDPYASARLFHGPAFQYLTDLSMGATGATARLDAGRGSVPRGELHQGLLDAATHAIPHDDLARWSGEIATDRVAYPYRIKEIAFYKPLPDHGVVELETRFRGFDGDARFPAIDVQLIVSGEVAVAFQLVEVLLPKGPIGEAPPLDRRAFLGAREPRATVSLSTFDGEATTLAPRAVRESDWLPGNVACIYGAGAARGHELVREVAIREHVARRAFVHPSQLTMEGDGARARVRPLRLHRVRVSEHGEAVTVRDDGPPRQDLRRVHEYWRERFAIGAWPVEDLYYGLIERFVGDVVIADPDGFAKVSGRSCLYLANHQVGVESLLFSVLTAALSGTPTVTLAKAEHRTSWLGKLIAHSFAYPGVVDPKVITFFDREDKESLLRIVGEIAREMETTKKSAMVHVEGTRSLACREPVVKMSSAFIDMACAIGAPIVPVRFVGGLPVEPLETRLEFPLAMGRQDYWIGSPILPEELSAMPYKERKARVIDALNGLGPSLAEEVPFAGDATFDAAVRAWMDRTGASHEHATLYATLAGRANESEAARRLVEAASSGALPLGPSAEDAWLAALARDLFGPHGPSIG